MGFPIFESAEAFDQIDEGDEVEIDPGDNHGSDGANVAFCDGRVSWVSQKDFLRSWYRGTDEDHAPVSP